MNGSDLASTFGLSSGLKVKLFAQVGRSKHWPTGEIWASLSGSLRKEIRSELRGKQKIVREYLNQEKIDPSNTILADVGWRGTIQDSLSLIAESEFTGCYLGLYDSYGFLGEFTKKSGLAFDYTRGNPAPEQLGFLGHIERSFTFSPFQSSGFHRSPRGVISPTFIDKHDGPSAPRQTSFERVVSIAESVGDAMFSSGFFGRESGEFVRAVMTQMSFEPNKFTSATWFDENHEEGFGTIDQVDKHSRYEGESEASSFQNAILLSNSQSAVLWPQGIHAWDKQSKKLER
jgi:hypothetical protein